MIRCGRGVSSVVTVDWTALPDLVLELIVDRLDSSKTCLRFLVVCKSWGSIVFRSCPAKFRSLLYSLACARHPMLLIGDKHVFSAFTGQVFPLDPVILPRHCSEFVGIISVVDGARSVTIGSSFGCLFIFNPSFFEMVTIIDSRQRRIMTVRHPITKKASYPQLIGSQPVKAVTAMDPKVDNIDNALVIWFRSSSSTGPDHLLLMKTSYTRRSMNYPRESRLHRICGRILDITSNDSIVFCLHTTAPEEIDWYVSRMSKLSGRPVRGRIVLYDDQSMSKKAKLPTPTLSRHCRAYLVGSDDGRTSWPWLVIRHKTIDCDGKMSTVGFQVFEGVRSVRRSRGTEFSFVRVNKLQNDALFIGKKSAIRLAAGSGLIAVFGLLQSNTVYYLDDGDREPNKVSDLDMGVFDMENACRRPFPILEHTKQLLSNGLMKHHSPPLWFLH